MTALFDYINAHRKAIIGGAVAFLTTIAVRYGFHFSADETGALTGVVTFLFVHLVPNAEKVIEAHTPADVDAIAKGVAVHLADIADAKAAVAVVPLDPTATPAKES